jgi:hypothetical protein
MTVLAASGAERLEGVSGEADALTTRQLKNFWRRVRRP